MENDDTFAPKFTAVGSLLSCLATFAILVYCIVSRKRDASLSHSLIVNLFLAEFLNTFNAVVSGFIYVDVHHLYSGTACAVNGFFALVTAQAVDFTIVAIVIGILLAVTGVADIPRLATWWAKVLVCSSIWTVPLITSMTAVSLDALKPVGGNWCDLETAKPGLRYALVDGWRLAVMILIIGLYPFIWWSIRQNGSYLAIINNMKPSDEKYTTKRTYSFATLSSRFSDDRSLLQASMRRARSSDISLPLQGYDFSGTDFQEREEAIESRTERISRWIYVRHPGLINSLKSQMPPPPLALRFDGGPQVTRSFSITTSPRWAGLTLATFPPYRPETQQIHGQQNLTQISGAPARVESSVEEEAPSSQYTTDTEVSVPRHNNHVPSAIRPADTRTESSSETVPWRLTAAGGQPNPVIWPFLDSKGSSVGSLSRSQTAETLLEHNDRPARRVLLPRLDSTRDATPPPVFATARLQQFSNQTANRAHERLGSPSTLLDRDRCAETSCSSIGLAGHPQISMPRSVPQLPQNHDQYPQTHRLYEIPSDAGEDTSGPSYPTRYSHLRRLSDVSINTLLKTQPSPKHPDHRPEVPQSTATTPFKPAFPLSRPPTHAAHNFSSLPTMFKTIASSRPPSSTPALPPSTRSVDSSNARRRTFLLSKSSWSESTASLRRARQSSENNNNNKRSENTARNARDIRRVLLLTAYPLAYVILWLPWMISSLMQTDSGSGSAAAGHDDAMHALVGLSQYLGVVNTVTFAFNRALRMARRRGKGRGLAGGAGGLGSGIVAV